MIGEITWYSNGESNRVESQSVSFEAASPEFRTRSAMLDWFTGVLESREGNLSALVAGNVMDSYGFRGAIKSDDTGEIVAGFSLVWECMK